MKRLILLPLLLGFSVPAIAHQGCVWVNDNNCPKGLTCRSEQCPVTIEPPKPTMPMPTMPEATMPDSGD